MEIQAHAKHEQQQQLAHPNVCVHDNTFMSLTIARSLARWLVVFLLAIDRPCSRSSALVHPIRMFGRRPDKRKVEEKLAELFLRGKDIPETRFGVLAGRRVAYMRVRRRRRQDAIDTAWSVDVNMF